LSQMQRNIEQARTDSSQFFKLTLVFAAIGFTIVMGGVILLYTGQIGAGIVTLISSSVPDVTAALFFHKDRELRKTLRKYHSDMRKSQTLLNLLDIAETIEDTDERDKMKQQIIAVTLGVPKSR
jgi:uncharacterized membrane protein